METVREFASILDEIGDSDNLSKMLLILVDKVNNYLVSVSSIRR